MSLAEIKDSIGALSVEERLDLAAWIAHLNHADDPVYTWRNWKRECLRWMPEKRWLRPSSSASTLSWAPRDGEPSLHTRDDLNSDIEYASREDVTIPEN